jgi:deoxyribonuclease I
MSRKFRVIFGLWFLSLPLFAQIEQILPNQKLAYYGSEFYAAKKVTKQMLFVILDQFHVHQANDFNKIQNSCPNSQFCFRHSSVGYTSARKILFSELYNEKDGGGSYVKDVYCGKKIYFKSVEDISSMDQVVNIEHTWPQSKFSTNFDKQMQKSDLHHLFPTDSFANNVRGNHEFGDESAQAGDVTDCQLSRIQEISGHIKFTPPANHKGNVARALFYFATRYNLFINPAEEMILRVWHKNDPVDAEEKRRHSIIASKQKNRNPFVDFPELVDQISDF